MKALSLLIFIGLIAGLATGHHQPRQLQEESPQTTTVPQTQAFRREPTFGARTSVRAPGLGLGVGLGHHGRWGGGLGGRWGGRWGGYYGGYYPTTFGRYGGWINPGVTVVEAGYPGVVGGGVYGGGIVAEQPAQVVYTQAQAPTTYVAAQAPTTTYVAAQAPTTYVAAQAPTQYVAAQAPTQYVAAAAPAAPAPEVVAAAELPTTTTATTTTATAAPAIVATAAPAHTTYVAAAAPAPTTYVAAAAPAETTYVAAAPAATGFVAGAAPSVITTEQIVPGLTYASPYFFGAGSRVVYPGYLGGPTTWFRGWRGGRFGRRFGFGGLGLGGYYGGVLPGVGVGIGGGYYGGGVYLGGGRRFGHHRGPRRFLQEQPQTMQEQPQALQSFTTTPTSLPVTQIPSSNPSQDIMALGGGDTTTPAPAQQPASIDANVPTTPPAPPAQPLGAETMSIPVSTSAISSTQPVSLQAAMDPSKVLSVDATATIVPRT